MGKLPDGHMSLDSSRYRRRRCDRFLYFLFNPNLQVFCKTKKPRSATQKHLKKTKTRLTSQWLVFIYLHPIALEMYPDGNVAKKLKLTGHWPSGYFLLWAPPPPPICFTGPGILFGVLP